MKQIVIKSLFIISFLLVGCKGQESESVKFLSEAELSTKSLSELRIIRNEVFAHKGYVFTSEDLQNYFAKKPWYHPRTSNEGIELNQKEKEYTDLIKKLEQK